jgi:two-component system response regulator DegU
MTVLTSRQCEILQLVANGFDYSEISLILNISYHTIKNHMSEINRRLNTTHRVEAIIYAAYLGLIDLDIAQTMVKSRIQSRYLI